MPRILQNLGRWGKVRLSYQGSLFAILPQLLTGSKQVSARPITADDALDSARHEKLPDTWRRREGKIRGHWRQGDRAREFRRIGCQFGRWKGRVLAPLDQPARQLGRDRNAED